MWSRTGFILFFLLVSTVLQVCSVHADEDYFKTINLQVKGHPIDYKVEDLNNDGLKDLLISHIQTTAEKRLRFFSIFFQNTTGYPASADQSFEVDEGAIIYDIADVSPAPGKEIVFFKNEGLYYYALKEDTYQPVPELLFKTDSLFKIADDSFLEHFDFIKDLNNDGIEEIMVPMFREYHIFYKGPNNQYELKSKLDVSMMNKLISSREVSRYLVSSYAIPNIVIADYNMDNRNDIIVVQNKYLKVFFQDATGYYSDTSSVNVDFWMELTQAYSLSLGHRSRFQRDRLQDKTGLNTLRDLNNDGLIDIIIERFSFAENAFNPKKKFYVFFGTKRNNDETKGGYFKEIPDRIIVSRGVHINSWVQDLNDDKQLDIIIPAVEIGLFKIISMLLTGSVDVTAYTYLMDENGNYPLSPDEETKYSMQFNRSSRKIPVEDFSGDYNGDGQNDFLGSKSETLFITFGTKNGKPEIKKTDIEFDFVIPSNGMNVKPEFINQDSKSDIIILYTDRDTGPDDLQKNVCILMTQR